MANGKMIGGEGEQGGDLDKIVPPLLMLDESAIKRGGERGGAYLDSLGRYDLSQLTPEEYTYFATCVVTGALEQMTAYLLSRLEQKIPF